MTTRTVISKSAKRFNRPKGSVMFIKTEMVVYKTKLPNENHTSQTRHELVRGDSRRKEDGNNRKIKLSKPIKYGKRNSNNR